mgnify:CR=1 FL=1
MILSPGLEPYDPAVKKEYGYGRLQNVVTSMDFERLLCATGPYEGEILRSSDKEHPHNIAWIQCIGSRKVTPGDNSYCSAVCCMYATKEAVIAKEHDPNLDIHVFFMDMRAFSKGYWSYFERARDRYGIEYHRCRISALRETPLTRT